MQSGFHEGMCSGFIQAQWRDGGPGALCGPCMLFSNRTPKVINSTMLVPVVLRAAQSQVNSSSSMSLEK